jgi:hypothetical protein
MLIGLLACVEGDPQPSPPDDPTCTDEGATELSAEVTAIGTVIRVRWRTDADVESHVAFETPTGTAFTSAETGEVHEALLVGNHPRSDVSWRIVSSAGNSCDRTTQTEVGVAGLSRATLTGDAEAGPGWVVAPIIMEERTGLGILDNTGTYIWAWAPEGDEKAASVFGAELALDGGSILFNTGAQSDTLPGPIYRIALDGTFLDPILVNGAHTDFVQLPDGEIGVLAWDVRAVGNRRFLGDTIVEVAADGTTHTVWSVWDNFTPDTAQTWTQGWYPGDPSVEDWSHVNGITYDPATDRYLVTASFNSSVLMIDRATGELDQMLVDGGGDWQSTEPLLSYPHSVDVVPDGVLVFNRGDLYATDSCSEATELDLSSDMATPTWEWAGESCLFVPFLGSAKRLSDGSTFVDWTTAGQVDRVTADGALAWRLNLDLGGGFGFAQVVEAPYGAR